ncbi:hypothetical protein LGM39_15165 [Burkholderia cepacia]|uniref:hypothetical protein n=1 Tax=Burkholderia cepacia TaxID=292 RepID=UPI001CF519D7|nr:hypothetical protein [Burkholderia cepacia]MCA7900718.1 hypothetical protein [Burkholderia cepacia]
MNTFGHEEGELCGRGGCEGRIEFTKPENCSCHISAPCSACTNTYLHCPGCGWEAQEQSFNDYIVTVNTKSHAYEAWRHRPLDPAKIDWHSKSHSSCSMIKEGVYPEGATREDVRKLVDGTFGGRFEYFEGGRFKFIAYTD